MSAVVPGGSKGAVADDGTADVAMGAGTQPTPDGFLTPPSAQNPAGQSWQDLLLGGGMASAAGGMLGVVSVQSSPTPTSLDPKVGLSQAVMPAVTGIAAAETSAQSAVSTLASRQQPESVVPDANPRLLVTQAAPSALSSQTASVLTQVHGGLSGVPAAKPVLGPDGAVAAGVVPSDRTPQLLSSASINLSDSSSPVAASILSKSASPSDAAPVASGSGAPPALTDGVPVDTSHKVDFTELAQPEQAKVLTPPSAAGASAAAGSVSQRLDPSQMAVHQSLIAPTILDVNAVLARVDQPLVPVAENILKPLAKRLGLGSESFYGQTAAVVNPLVDTAFQVAPTTAVVADGALAETVSYWAANGVQNATMQLDGLGSEPVEVSISMNGDMAQVDFRTNQVAVQQVIEAAAGQLKDMLMSQGLQLAGLSIGQSGLGGQADKGQKQAGEVKKIAMIDSQPVLEPQRGRSVNLSVGQSLDLFV
jgi:flagellar hook-length control protein FliK